MPTVTRTRSLKRSGHPLFATGLEESTCVVAPGLLVKIRSEEPAGVVWQQGVNASGEHLGGSPKISLITSQQMTSKHLVR
jgi:hypothetical protein